MSLLLHKATGKNRFCGPHVISFLTGMSTDQASRLIRSWNGRTMITGMHTGELLRTLNMCNIHASEVWDETHKSSRKRITLNQWMQLSTHDRSAGLLNGVLGYQTFVVTTSSHYQIVQGDFYLDNANPDPILFEDLVKGKRQRIKTVHRMFVPKGLEVVIPDEANKPQHDWHGYRRKAAKLAKELRVSIEVDTNGEVQDEFDTVWSYLHDDDIDQYGDPWDDEHFVYGFRDLYERLVAERSRRNKILNPVT